MKTNDDEARGFARGIEAAARRADELTEEVKGWTARAPARVTSYVADEIRALAATPPEPTVRVTVFCRHCGRTDHEDEVRAHKACPAYVKRGDRFFCSVCNSPWATGQHKMSCRPENRQTRAQGVSDPDRKVKP